MIDQSLSFKLSKQQLQEFSRNGFFVIGEFLDAPEIRDLIDSVESLDPDAPSSRVRRGVAFARRNLLELDFVRALVARSCVREVVDSIAPGSTAVRAILFDKSGSANWTVPWHQDRSIAVRKRLDIPGFGPWSQKAGVIHVQPPRGILQQMVSLRFHLDPCGSENGPLRVIPATHQSILDQKELETAVASRQQCVCATHAGGLVAMRPLAVHASSPAKEPSHRRVIHIEFGPPTLPGGMQWAMA